MSRSEAIIKLIDYFEQGNGMTSEQFVLGIMTGSLKVSDSPEYFLWLDALLRLALENL